MSYHSAQELGNRFIMIKRPSPIDQILKLSRRIIRLSVLLPAIPVRKQVHHSTQGIPQFLSVFLQLYLQFVPFCALVCHELVNRIRPRDKTRKLTHFHPARYLDMDPFQPFPRLLGLDAVIVCLDVEILHWGEVVFYISGMFKPVKFS